MPRMIRAQIELPDHLYVEVKRIAREREISMSEVIRRGLEHITRRVYPPLPKGPGRNGADRPPRKRPRA